jgi:thioredoxin-like negative regulator of GroEL
LFQYFGNVTYFMSFFCQDYTGALSILRPLAASPTAPPELVFALARIMMEAGDSSVVQALSARVTADSNADHGTTAMTQALEAAMLGRWNQAEEVLRKALEAEKDNAVVGLLPLRFNVILMRYYWGVGSQ